jgi:hypothetical protein
LRPIKEGWKRIEATRKSSENVEVFRATDPNKEKAFLRETFRCR